MFVHVLSYFLHQNLSVVTTTTDPLVNLNGWIGFSFSKSHATRDMFAFVTANSTIFDLYSLFYSAPYLDNSIHIVGTDDIRSIADSATYNGGLNTHYFFGGIARLYDTGDSMGDEILRKKMNNTYCYAISFLEANNSFAHSPILRSNMHSDYECFTSFITLSEGTIVLSLLMLLVTMIV